MDDREDAAGEEGDAEMTMHDDIVPECDREPFDAERAMAGEPVCSADGRPVHYIKLSDDIDAQYPVVANVVGYGHDRWTITGELMAGETSSADLRMIRQPAKETMTEAEAAEAKQCIALPPASTPTRYDPAACEPFNRARAEKGEAVCDDEGKPVLVLHYDDADKMIACLERDGKELCWHYAHELRMAPRKAKRWWVRSWIDPKFPGQRQLPRMLFPNEAEARRGLLADETVSFTDIP
jgi:hypothetical protein